MYELASDLIAVDDFGPVPRGASHAVGADGLLLCGGRPRFHFPARTWTGGTLDGAGLELTPCPSCADLVLERARPAQEAVDAYPVEEIVYGSEWEPSW
jgi:hypothetical protein